MWQPGNTNMSGLVAPRQRWQLWHPKRQKWCPKTKLRPQSCKHKRPSSYETPDAGTEPPAWQWQLPGCGALLEEISWQISELQQWKRRALADHKVLRSWHLPPTNPLTPRGTGWENCLTIVANKKKLQLKNGFLCNRNMIHFGELFSVVRGTTWILYPWSILMSSKVFRSELVKEVPLQIFCFDAGSH